MGWVDAIRIAGTAARISGTVVFQDSLKKCACKNDTKYTDQFTEFYYDNLIKRKIVLQMNDFWVFNHPDHFVENKYTELESLLKKFDFEECTKNKILEFYKSETGMTMNVVNKYGGRKTRNKRSLSKKKTLHKKTTGHKKK